MRRLMIGLLTDILELVRSHEDLASIFLQTWELATIARPQVVRLKDEIRLLREHLAVISRPVGPLFCFSPKGDKKIIINNRPLHR